MEEHYIFVIGLLNSAIQKGNITSSPTYGSISGTFQNDDDNDDVDDDNNDGGSGSGGDDGGGDNDDLFVMIHVHDIAPLKKHSVAGGLCLWGESSPTWDE